MSTGRDDDALHWGGDDDPTLDVGTTRDAERSHALALPDGFTAVGKGSADVGHIEADGTIVPAGTPAPLGSAMLIGLGILAGVYLLFLVGWIIGGLRLQDVAVFLVSPAAYAPAFWLAVLAPVIWFLTVYLLTRGSAAWVRLTWLIAGALLFIPWPFIMIGVVGR